jgi:hypothetical protein
MRTTTMVVAALAAVVLAGCSPSTGSAAADAQSACVAVSGTVGPDQICHVHSATSSYTRDDALRTGQPGDGFANRVEDAFRLPPQYRVANCGLAPGVAIDGCR